MTDTTMGSRIEQARLNRGYSVRKLATGLGVKATTIENWERDRSEPRSNKLLMLSGLLNVPVLWLLQGKGEEGGPTCEPASINETATLLRKLERATSMQDELSALLAEAKAEISRLQKELDSEENLAA